MIKLSDPSKSIAQQSLTMINPIIKKMYDNNILI